MYRIQKRLMICGGHQLQLDYESPCSRWHGHNWFITVYMRAEKLDRNGMVFDFAKIKKIIHDKMDHMNLNDVVDFNPTAENMACYLCARLNVEHTVDDIERGLRCYRIDIEETPNNVATYEED